MMWELSPDVERRMQRVAAAPAEAGVSLRKDKEGRE